MTVQNEAAPLLANASGVQSVSLPFPIQENSYTDRKICGVVLSLIGIGAGGTGPTLMYGVISSSIPTLGKVVISITSLSLTALGVGGLIGGVYTYLNHEDRTDLTDSKTRDDVCITLQNLTLDEFVRIQNYWLDNHLFKINVLREKGLVNGGEEVELKNIVDRYKKLYGNAFESQTVNALRSHYREIVNQIIGRVHAIWAKPGLG